MSNMEYSQMRDNLLLNKEIADKLPRFARTCRDSYQFWGYIKQFPGYAARREHIWDGFRPVFEYLESQGRNPADDTVAEVLAKLDIDHVSDAWKKALERRGDDPEGAITAAKSLLETVCKCILDDLRIAYGKTDDLPKLYHITADSLRLAPNQHSQQIVKQTLGSCQNVVQGVGYLRNLMGDSHGKGKDPIKPEPHHAELAVNLAGSVSMFLVSTWKTEKSSHS